MRFRAAWLIFLVLCLSAGACHRKPPTVPAPVPISPPPPPAPTSFNLGENYYNEGHYSEAAQAYGRYLFENQGIPNRDKALFRMAMCYAFLGAEPENQQQAQERLKFLVKQFPASPYRREAEFILGLQASLEKLRINIEALDASLNEREAALEAKDVSIKGKDKALSAREAAIRERDATLKEKDATIERLTRELDRLKKIDLDRRPSRPPD